MMAVCAAAAHEAVGDAGLAPVALGANYLASPNPGELDLITAIRRRGRQVSLVEVELAQQGRLAVTCSITLGPVDGNDPRHQEPLALADFPATPPPEAIPATPDHVLGKLIHFAQGCDLRMEPTTTRFLEGHQGPTYLRRRPAPGWLRVVASSTVIGDSWFEEDHVVLDETGHVVAQSRQLAMLPKSNWQPA
jgi:hypothetical protein